MLFSHFETVDISVGEKSQVKPDIELKQGITTQLDIIIEQGAPTPDSHDTANDPIFESECFEEVDGQITDLLDNERDHPGSQPMRNDVLYDDEFMGLDGEVRDSITEFQLGQTFQPGNFKTWGPRLIAQRCMQLAKKGSASSQYRLGCMYFQGVGVEQSYLMAYVWCKVSALQNSLKASLKLEELKYYLTGEHIFYATQLSKRYYDKYVTPFSQ